MYEWRTEQSFIVTQNTLAGHTQKLQAPLHPLRTSFGRPSSVLALRQTLLGEDDLLRAWDRSVWVDAVASADDLFNSTVG